MAMKALTKPIVTLLAGVITLAALAVGCSSVPSASKEPTTNTTVLVYGNRKNDPDHIYYIYPDGTVEKVEWPLK